jgi:hypothetical protein
MNTTFKAPFWLPDGHFQSIYPSIFRKIKDIDYKRERLELPDGDFLDLDWLKNKSNKLVVLTHGLEGNSTRAYILGMAKTMQNEGYDVLAWNCRSCSGEMNRLLRLYNHGDPSDLAAVIKHALQNADYQKVALVGFSMGGALTMNYLGRTKDIPTEVVSGVGFSMPTDLTSSVPLLDLPKNWLYKRKFLTQLSNKVRAKAQLFPDVIDLSHLEKIKVWRDFDVHYTTLLGNYATPEDFYTKGSSVHVLHEIKVPFLICNAENDPILSPECSPKDLANALPLFTLETPKDGGHVGFFPFKNKESWMDWRVRNWLNTIGF